MWRKIVLSIYILSLVSLAGCAPGSTPVQIASYPKGGEPSSTTRSDIVYEAFFVLEVDDLSQAAWDVSRLAYDCGGYVVSDSSTSPEVVGHTRMVIAVPTYRYEAARRGLLRIGKLTSERSLGQAPPSGSSASTFSRLTADLYPKRVYPYAYKPTGWNPGHTFEQALAVSVAIFRFGVDALIWLLVVAGPFFLVGWGIYRLVKKLNSPK
jgi:hypothetical protein